MATSTIGGEFYRKGDKITMPNYIEFHGHFSGSLKIAYVTIPLDKRIESGVTVNMSGSFILRCNNTQVYNGSSSDSNITVTTRYSNNWVTCIITNTQNYSGAVAQGIVECEFFPNTVLSFD